MKTRSSRFLLLALLVATASHAAAQSAPSLQSRVNALAEQIQLRYQHFEPGLDLRRGQVERVLAEWNAVLAAGQATPANKDAMADWLERALRSVMAGGSGAIPDAPAFSPGGPQLAAEQQPAGEAVPAEPREVEPAGPGFPGGIVREVAPTPLPPTRTVRPQAPEPTEGRFAGPRTAPQKRSSAKPVTPAAPGPASRSKWSRHPSAAPLEWKDPFADDPSASPNPLRSGARREALRPAVQPVSAVRVDLDQLASQVRGYNEAIRELHASVRGVGNEDVTQLINAVERLETLQQKQVFLDLYRNGLTDAQRRVLPRSPSVALVRELVRRKAKLLLEQTPPTRQAERRVLQQVTQRLAKVETPSF